MRALIRMVCTLAAGLALAASSAAGEPTILEATQLTARADTSNARVLRVAQVVELAPGPLRNEPLEQMTEPPSGFWVVKNLRRLYHVPEPAELKRHGFQVVVPIDQGAFEAFKHVTDCSDCFLMADGDVLLSTGSATYRLAPAQLEAASRGSIGLSRGYLDGLRRTYGVEGTDFRYENRLDVSKRVDVRAAGQEVYTATFALTSPWIWPGNFLRVSGQWSSQPHDSLNRIYFYPANVALWRQGSAVSDLKITSGIETGSSGVAQYGRGAVALLYTTLIPNLVDFTAGENRFRPSPEFGIGFKALAEWGSTKIRDEDRRWGEAFATAHYYVPIFGEYSATLEASTFFPFRERPKRDDWQGLFSVTLGTNVPGIALKPLLKYTRGADDVNGRDLTQIGLGLLYDIMPKRDRAAKGGD